MVELDKKFNPQNSGTELDEKHIFSLPLPIYDAYRLLERETDYEKSLQVLCLSLIPWTYQYIALVLSGEYLVSKNKPSCEVTDNLLNMIKKPGPGKWIGFIRAATAYFIEYETTVLSREAIMTLNTVLNEKGRPLVKVPDNENRLEYTDALISIRNRFAHSRSITGEKAKELFLDYFHIWKALINIIGEVFTPRLLYRSSMGDSYNSFDNRPLDKEYLPFDQDIKHTLFWNDASRSYIRLYPIIVTYAEDPGNSPDVAFLEEIRNKYLFYLQGDNYFKLKDEFEVLSRLIETKTIKEDVVTAECLTLKTFSDRIDRITNQTINDFRDALKYIPEIYLARPSMSENLDTWLESSFPGCIISGNPGTGKTSLITNWCVQRKIKGDHVLLFEASRLNDSDITGIIEKELNLGSPLKDCLDSIQRQNGSLSGEQKPRKFIIVIDAVNEFTGSENENRNRLWREINSLIGILYLYNPCLKCLVTTRSDLWTVDFPEKNSAFDMLKEKLYWKSATEGFPRMEVGNLTMTEAEEIFEKARNSFPSMAVQTSFNNLSERTKRVLCNPFFMRLALVTYNGRKVPDLTKSKIESQYARERITEEKDKKTVLFALLERMSQLRKTEVTIDEFLYSDTKSRFKRRKTEKEKRTLEKLIYDPRPQSSFKKLVREGIIEERTGESTIESKERIRFSQEKITDIIHSEFQRRDLKRKTKMLIAFGIYTLICFGIMFIVTETDLKSFNARLKTDISTSIQDAAISDEIYSVSSELISKTDHAISRRYGLFLALTFLPFFGLIILIWYSVSYGARIIKNDLPSRFIKGKFTELKQKKIWYGLVAFAIILILLYVNWMVKPENSNLSFNDSFEPFLKGTPVFFLFVILWDIVLGSIIVYRFANSPLDAFSIFGKKEVIQTCFEIVPVIPFIILVYLSTPVITSILDLNNDKNLIDSRQKWLSNEAVSSLKDQNPELFSIINEAYLYKTDKIMIGSFISWWKMFLNVIFFSFCALIPLYLLLKYLNGFLLYKLLKRKL